MNKTTIICLLALCLLSSCAVQTICPAYQSAFVLDKSEQENLYSLFTVVDGDTVPKRPYGFRFKAEDGDTLMEKFIKGTSGSGFRVQGGRVHSLEKSGFTYKNRVKEKLWARVFRGKEKPVLENPYLFDRITKKRPFYKLDNLEMDLVHFNGTEYDSLLRARINRGDTTRYDSLMVEMAQYPSAIRVQYAPLLRGGFNNEQEQYNKRFGAHFLKMKEVKEPEPVDSTTLQQFAADTVAVDTAVKKKRGLGGLFKKKKNKPPKPKKEKRKNKKKNNKEGVLEEEDN